LFPSAETKGGSTIGTLDRLVLKTHWVTSSLLNLSWSSVTQYFSSLKLFEKACNN
jgi:hypothetical protein